MGEFQSSNLTQLKKSGLNNLEKRLLLKLSLLEHLFRLQKDQKNIFRLVTLTLRSLEVTQRATGIAYGSFNQKKWGLIKIKKPEGESDTHCDDKSLTLLQWILALNIQTGGGFSSLSALPVNFSAAHMNSTEPNNAIRRVKSKNCNISAL